MAQYRTILLPTDGRDHAEEATEIAFRLAREQDSRVHTLFVVDTRLYGEPALSSVELFIDDLDKTSSDLLSEVVGRGNEHGIDVTRNIRHGNPHEAIVEYAEEIDADLIVMGYQGASHRKHMGSVVEHVIEETDRHVLVI
jgi:nucleotide-binding universal stress UspA family protein